MRPGSRGTSADRRPRRVGDRPGAIGRGWHRRPDLEVGIYGLAFLGDVAKVERTYRAQPFGLCDLFDSQEVVARSGGTMSPAPTPVIAKSSSLSLLNAARVAVVVQQGLLHHLIG